MEGLPPYLLKGTNCTISLGHFIPFDDIKTPESPSSYSILAKLAFPTPTIIIEAGKLEFLTIISFVAAMSWISPSVRINKIW